MPGHTEPFKFNCTVPQLSYPIFSDCSETSFALFNGNPLPCFLTDKETLKIKAANHSASLFYAFDHEDLWPP